MKNILLVLLVAFCASGLYAQQESIFTQFMYNQQTVNPGYVGSRGIPSLMALYRNQWLGFEGSPENIVLAYDSPFLNDRVGFGISAVRQSVGRFQNLYGNLAYSYGIPVSDALTVRIGLQGTAYYNQISLTGDAVIFDDNDMSIFMNSDPAQLKGNFGAGIYIHSDRFYFGVSSPYFLSNEIGFNDEVDITAFKEAHYYGLLGVTVPMSEKVELRPAFQGRYVPNAPFQLDANLSVIFNKKFTLGTSYRTGGEGTGESIDFLMFLQLSKRMGLGAAYDYTLTEINNYSNGTFELMLRYDFKAKRSDLEDGREFKEASSGSSKSKKSKKR
ncbi:MAG: type IX secretion system membrane protein PorP/SprF [Bacteroidota bacterium]